MGFCEQGWRLTQCPESYVAKIYEEKYFSNSTFGEKKPWYAWRNIWNAKKHMQLGMRWRVGDGKKINIWHDKWVHSPTTNTIQTPVRILEGDGHCKHTHRREHKVHGGKFHW
jgi:hypothetical protein